MLFFEINGSYEEINRFIKPIVVNPLLLNDENQIDDDDDNDEEEENIDIDEISFYNGNNELVKIFNEKCCICLENDSCYIFKKCGHRCICNSCYQIGVKLPKCNICRT